MSLRVPSPRLLPITIAALAALLAMKSVELVRAAVPTAAEAQGGHPSAGQPTRPDTAAQPAKATPGATTGAKMTGATLTGPPPPPGPATASSPPVAVQPPPAAEPPPINDSERTLLLELRQRRQELDAREAALTSREAVLSAAERKIGARVDELQALQVRLEALETARKARDESNWRGLVKLYESMKPRDAAAIFNDLDMTVLLQVVDRMKEAKAAAVMAAMQPEKARQVTTELAQMRTRANADPDASGG